MLINGIVVGITAVMLLFVAIWWLFPALRSSIETPKYQVAEWDRDAPMPPCER